MKCHDKSSILQCATISQILWDCGLPLATSLAISQLSSFNFFTAIFRKKSSHFRFSNVSFWAPTATIRHRPVAFCHLIREYEHGLGLIRH